MLFTEDPVVLKEFEDLEAACEEIAKIKIKATEQEQILKQENQHNNHNDAVEKSPNLVICTSSISDRLEIC